MVKKRYNKIIIKHNSNKNINHNNKTKSTSKEIQIIFIIIEGTVKSGGFTVQQNKYLKQS